MLVAGTFKTSCKTGEGVENMFSEIAKQLVESNRSRIDLERLTENNGLKLTTISDTENTSRCSC